MIAFDSVSVVVLDGDYAKLHSLYIEGVEREGRESVQRMLDRTASDLNIDHSAPGYP